MTLGQKIKKLRNENNLTQAELADKIFVTRTAISKWETDNGYPSIDSLKTLSNLFNVSIDELISNSAVEENNKFIEENDNRTIEEDNKLIEEKNARKMYFVAIAFLGLTVLSTLLAYFLKVYYLNFVAIVGLIGYLVFGLLSKPKYKRLEARKNIIPYLISRIVLFVVFGAIIYTLATL